MKALPLLAAPLFLLASCQKEKAPVATVPVADPAPVAVPAVRDDNAFRPDGTPRQEVTLSPAATPPPVATEVPETVPTVDVDEEEPVPRTPGEHVDRAIQKTDEGIRKGLDATGRALQRVGEKIEDEANKNAPPR